MVEIYLDIPEELHDQLFALSEVFSQGVEDTVVEVLDGLRYEAKWFMELKRRDVIPLNLRQIISNNLSSWRMADNHLFSKILAELKAEGHYRVDDMQIDLEDPSIWVNYYILKGSELHVDEFEVSISSMKHLTADCLLTVDENDNETYERVNEHAQKICSVYKELPPEFRNSDDRNLKVLIPDETSVTLRAYFAEEYWGYFPPIPVISRFFEKILESAGVMSMRARFE